MNIIMPKHVEETENGLIFYSNQKPGFGVQSYLSEDNEINLKYNFFHLIEKTNQRRTLKEAIIALLLVVMAFVLRPYVSINIVGGTLMFLISCYTHFFTLCEKFFHSHITKKGREQQQFYTAKHMLLNSYKKLNGIPNLWELKNKYYNECDLYTIIHDTFIAILFSIAFYFYQFSSIGQFLLFYTGNYVVCSIISRVIQKLNLFTHLEWFFLAEPTDLQLQTAIKGLEAWIEMESKLQKEMHDKNSY